MEDNNYRHEKFDDCLLCNHPVLKHILTALLVFLGAFAAFTWYQTGISKECYIRLSKCAEWIEL